MYLPVTQGIAGSNPVYSAKLMTVVDKYCIETKGVAMNDYGGWIEVIPSLKANVQVLLDEFKANCEHRVVDVVGTNAILVQRKFHLMLDNVFAEGVDLFKMPHTMEMYEAVKPFVTFNSVNYRFVMPNTCYNWHTDIGKNCIHIPLVTNAGAWFVYQNKCFHMPSNGSAYLVNNLRMHSFMNAGRDPRLHLTFELLVT